MPLPWYAGRYMLSRTASDIILKTLDAAKELISAGNVWDSAVNEAMSIIEKEERRYAPSILSCCWSLTIPARVTTTAQRVCNLLYPVSGSHCRPPFTPRRANATTSASSYPRSRHRLSSPNCPKCTPPHHPSNPPSSRSTTHARYRTLSPPGDAGRSHCRPQALPRTSARRGALRGHH